MKLRRVGGLGEIFAQKKKNSSWLSYISCLLFLQARVHLVVESQEFGVDERAEHVLADGAIQVPQPLSLLNLQPQSWHFDEFASYAVDEMG
jgi:hypothetical protein